MAKTILLLIILLLVLGAGIKWAYGMYRQHKRENSADRTELTEHQENLEDLIYRADRKIKRETQTNEDAS